MGGQLDVLNCGEGHLEIRFDEKDLIENERAKRIIKDMLRRGYALFIHGKGNTLVRVKKFVPETGTYIIADGPEVPPEAVPIEGPKRRGRQKSVPMASSHATVVGRSAGG